MSNVDFDFTKLPIGTKVFDFVFGWCEITKISATTVTYPVHVAFADHEATYTHNGCLHIGEMQRLFLREVKFEVPEDAYTPPLPDLKKDTPVLVRNLEVELWCKRHFSHFARGNMFVFSEGRTSWTANQDTDGWDFWKLPEETDETYRDTD